MQYGIQFVTRDANSHAYTNVYDEVDDGDDDDDACMFTDIDLGLYMTCLHIHVYTFIHVGYMLRKEYSHRMQCNTALPNSSVWPTPDAIAFFVLVMLSWFLNLQ